MEQDQSSVPVTIYPLPGTGTLIKETLRHYQSNIQSILLIMLAPVVLMTASYLSPLISLAGSVLMIFASAALAVLLLAPEKSQTPSVGGYYKKGLSYVFPYIWVSFLTSLVVLGGVFLFIVPGIILGLLLAFASYSVVLEEKRGFSALVISYHYVKGRWFAVAGRSLLFSLMLIVPIIIIGALATSMFPGTTEIVRGVEVEQASFETNTIMGLLSYFIITPLIIIFWGILYRELQKNPVHVMTEEEEKRIKRNFSIFIGIGIVGIILALVLAVVFIDSIYAYLDSVSLFLGGFES